jgi:hypothetical protein
MLLQSENVCVLRIQEEKQTNLILHNWKTTTDILYHWKFMFINILINRVQIGRIYVSKIYFKEIENHHMHVWMAAYCNTFVYHVTYIAIYEYACTLRLFLH